jgi:hypothetical protein
VGQAARPSRQAVFGGAFLRQLTLVFHECLAAVEGARIPLRMSVAPFLVASWLAKAPMRAMTKSY